MKEKINKGYYFELMDRCHVQMSMIEDHLLTNPQLTKKMRRKLVNSQELIMDVYQWAGRKDRKESGNA
jgi:hypothetical protein